jgi:hypothetical protein
MVIVQGEPDLRIVVPCWMLDEGCCAAMVVEERGRIAVEALVALRCLVDGQGLSAGGRRGGCDSLMAYGDNHELPATDRTTGTNPGMDATPGGT